MEIKEVGTYEFELLLTDINIEKEVDEISTTPLDFKIIVEDTTAPLIDISEIQELKEITEGEYTLDKIKEKIDVTELSEYELKLDVLEGNFDKEGTLKIEVNVTDEYGNKAEKAVITLKVVAKPVEEVEPTPETPTNNSGNGGNTWTPPTNNGGGNTGGGTTPAPTPTPTPTPDPTPTCLVYPGNDGHGSYWPSSEAAEQWAYEQTSYTFGETGKWRGWGYTVFEEECGAWIIYWQ